MAQVCEIAAKIYANQIVMRHNYRVI
jgi:hypothetical protein